MKAKGNCKRLGDLLLFNARGIQPEYADTGLPVINSKHVLRNEILYDNDNRRALGGGNNNFLIQSGDVLINGTGVGTIGRAAVYLRESPALPDNHVTILRPNDNLNPAYLAVFLNSLAGQLQVDQRLRGSSGQIELYPTDIAEFQVWIAPKALQLTIRKLVEQSYALRQGATSHLSAAEQTLLKALGLDTWTPPEALSYVRASSQAFAAGRLDAEHFQPRFAALAAMMNTKGNCGRLGSELLVNTRGKQPEYTDTGMLVINSKHVLRNEVCCGDDNRRAVFDDESLLIQTDDVLINGTGVGTIGRAAAYLHKAPALPDNHVTILRPNNKLDPVYLAVFLNSLAGRLQVDQRLRGSSGQIELYPADIAEFQIWIAPKSLQLDIRRLVEQSYAHRQHAARLLDAAKRAVEIAIEDSEAAALAYLAQASA